jgi:hypothetical protein
LGCRSGRAITPATGRPTSLRLRPFRLSFALLRLGLPLTCKLQEHLVNGSTIGFSLHYHSLQVSQQAVMLQCLSGNFMIE